MSKLLSVVLYNPDPELPFDRPFEAVKNTTIVGKASTFSELKESIKNNDLDLIAVNLDGKDGLNIVKHITVALPNCSIVGISSKADPRTIITAMRTGCGQFVSWPVDPLDLQEAIEQARSAYMATTLKSKTICLVGSAGGVGTTTVACNQ